MKQRGFALLLQFLPYIIGFVLIAGLAGAIWWKVEHWCNAVCRTAQEQFSAAVSERDVLVLEKKAAQERATALALAWSAQVDKTEAASRERKQELDRTFRPLVERAKDVASRAPDGRGTTFGIDTARLLADAASAANAARSPPEREKDPDPVPIAPDWETWGVLAAQAYADAVNQHRACLDFYVGLQKAQQ
jgi:hypothetical protein